MPRHQDKDVSFDPPPDWVDRTFVAFTAPPGLVKDVNSAPNIVMTREPMRDGDTLRTHSDRQLIELGKQLKDFDLLESKETTLGGLPAILLRYRWISQVGTLEQAMVVAERTRPDKGTDVTTFTTTTTPADAPRARPIFDEILRTVRFSPAGGAPPPVRPSLAPPLSDEPSPLVPMPGFRGEPGSRR